MVGTWGRWGERRVSRRGACAARGLWVPPLLNPPPVGAEVKPRSERLIDGGPANGSTTTARPWRSSGRAAGGPLSCPRGGRASGSPLLNPPSVREEVRRGEREANRHGPANGSTTTARPWRSSGRAAGGPLSCPRGGRASGSPLLNPPSVREEARRGSGRRPNGGAEANRRGPANGPRPRLALGAVAVAQRAGRCPVRAGAARAVPPSSILPP